MALKYTVYLMCFYPHLTVYHHLSLSVAYEKKANHVVTAVAPLMALAHEGLKPYCEECELVKSA